MVWNLGNAQGAAVEEWLTSVGLAGRITAFRDQSITIDQLDDLTDDDLRELGLTIGERKRFRRALQQRQPDHTPGVIGTTRAERRPLTMMFVDVVNSSALGERLEPEDLLEVIRRYREFCGAAIMRYGGLIARLVGDGILAYFCYPVANENDPERAVRAALDIVRGIATVATPAGRPIAARSSVPRQTLLPGCKVSRRLAAWSLPRRPRPGCAGCSGARTLAATKCAASSSTIAPGWYTTTAPMVCAPNRRAGRYG